MKAMKRIIHLLTAAAAAMVAAAALVSCDKNNPNAPNKSNPTEFSLPGHDFTVMVEDYERGFSKDSNYVFEGIFKDGEFRFGLDKLDPMTLNILPDNQNQIILKVNSDSPGFDGVNASSSSRCINIIADGKDHTTYHLEWVSEGESTITLWCGEGTTRKEISFKATSKKEIPLKGIKMRIDGEEIYMCNVISFDENGELRKDGKGYCFEGTDYFGNKTERLLTDSQRSGIKWTHKNPLDPTVHHTIEIVGPEPLNATTPELHILFDGFGIRDPWQRVTYNGEMWYNWSDDMSVYPTKKMFNLYDGNLENYPDFRWFAPLTAPEYRGDPWDSYNENLPYYSKTICPIIPNLYLEDTKYSLKPADLRERRTIIYDATGDFRGTMIPLIFSTKTKIYDGFDIRLDGYIFNFYFKDSRYIYNSTNEMLY